MIKRFIEISTVEEVTVALNKGLSFEELASLSESYGYKVVGLKIDFSKLKQAVQKLPALVYLEIGSYKHFVVVRGISDTEIWYADPSLGNVYLYHETFLKRWTGQRALFIAKDVSMLRNSLLETPRGIDPSLQILRSQVLR